MAIKSVTNANLAEYVAERTIKSTEIQTPSQMTDAVVKVAEAKAGDEPVIVEAKETKPNVTGAPDPGDQEPTAKKKNPVQPRIDELTAQKRELEEFAESEYEMRLRAEKRIGELEAELKTSKPEVKAEVKKEDVEPDPTTYTDQKEFLKDWGKWNRNEALKEFNKIEADRQFQVEQGKINARIAEQITVAKAEFPDFVEVIESGTKVFVPEHIKMAILDSDVGAHLAYHIRKNPDVEKHLYSLTPAKALMELGQLALKFTKEASPEASTKTSTTENTNTTKAPPPPPSLKGKEAGIVPTNTSAPMIFKDYRNARIEQQRTNKRR